jgi:glutamine synthetase
MAELHAYLAKAPHTRAIEVLIADVNGILRGKRIGRDEFEALYRSGIKFCGSTTLLDCKGATIAELGLGSKDGDPDVMAHPVPGTLVPVTWLDAPTAQVMLSLHGADGSPYHSDPRTVLNRALKPLLDLGLKPVIATELEFYLLEDTDAAMPRPKMPRVPGTGLRQDGLQYSMLEDLWERDGFLADVAVACEAQGLPAGATLAEFSPGQFEINLHHVDAPALACDQCLMLKRIIKGVARRHGMGATFMAKPFAEYAGSGLHVHMSLYEESGRNVFAEPGSKATPPISATLRHAIGGLIETMAEGMAIFAPNGNSYRRLRPQSFVPLAPLWGYNHRSLAVRIPMSDPEDLRIEHRVAGADASPFLVIAAIAAGVHYGIVNRCEPGPMIAEGTWMEEERIELPVRWDAALAAFDRAEVLPQYLGGEFRRIYSIIRHSEEARFHAEITNRDYEWYLRAV